MLLLLSSALAAPAPLSPADGALVGVPITFTVQTEQTTTIHVRSAGEKAEPFRLVVLPGTRRLVTDDTIEEYGDLFAAQTDWIAANADEIAFVTHLGDIVQDWDDVAQWERADAAMSTLDGVVPYGLVMGNSDYPIQFPEKMDQELFSTYFPTSRFLKEDWWGAEYPKGSNHNSFQTFSSGGLDFLILHLQHEPDGPVLEWASSVISSYSTHRVIISTHVHLDAEGELVSMESYDAEEGVWSALVEPHENVFLVLSGHRPGEAQRSDDVGGRTVHQLLSCYQDRLGDGEGVLRLLDFSPEENLISVTTYSPATSTFEEDADSMFTLDYPMSGFVVAGSGEPEAGVVSVEWTPEQSGAYEWFAETADGQTTDLWTFSTDSGAPIISDIFISGLAETGTALVTWSTDKPTFGEVLINGLSAAQSKPEAVKHTLELTGLSPEFALQIIASDTAGNVTESKVLWVTLGSKKDTGTDTDDSGEPAAADDTSEPADTGADSGEPTSPEGCGGCGAGAPGGGLLLVLLLLPLRRARGTVSER